MSKRELDLYEREFMVAQSTSKILEAEEESLERENINLQKLSEARDENNAFLKAQTMETKKHLARQLEKLQ